MSHLQTVCKKPLILPMVTAGGGMKVEAACKFMVPLLKPNALTGVILAFHVFIIMAAALTATLISIHNATNHVFLSCN